jgi:hypothetical protein
MSAIIYSPSATYVITSGWNNPTYAYASDGLYTTATASAAAQGYNGYHITGSGTITKVEIGIEGYCDISGQSVNLYVSFDGGNTWNLLAEYYEPSEQTYYYDATSYVTSWTQLNDSHLVTEIYAVTAGGCFVEGTEILTPEGFKKIEDINAGEYIIGEENGKRVFTRVRVKTQHYGDWMQHTYEEIGFAGNHKVWVKGEWRDVYNVQPIATKYKGFVYNIETQTGTLIVGRKELLVHNLSKD